MKKSTLEGVAGGGLLHADMGRLATRTLLLQIIQLYAMPRFVGYSHDKVTIMASSVSLLGSHSSIAYVLTITRHAPT